MGGSLVTGHGHSLSSTRGMDQLRVVGVAPSATVTVASALSPGYLLFPFSDSGFASLSSASSSLSLSLPDPGPSSSSLRSTPPLSSSFSSSSYSFLPLFLGSFFLSSSLPFCFFPSSSSWFPSSCFLLFFCSSFFLFLSSSYSSSSLGILFSSYSLVCFFQCLCFCSSCLFFLFCFFCLFLSRLCCLSGYGVRIV